MSGICARACTHDVTSKLLGAGCKWLSPAKRQVLQHLCSRGGKD